MQLNTREWGSGERVALLVHGIMSDSRTWRRVGPALAAGGYRVVAVDLRGHGASGRSEDYSAEAYAADLVESAGGLGAVELALGHSLGGLALERAAPKLRPARAVYLDPAWLLPTPELGFDPSAFVRFADAATAQTVAAASPRWEREDVDVELATLECWDRGTAAQLAGIARGSRVPEAPVVPSLVIRPSENGIVSEEQAETLRQRGFEVRSVEGAGHTVHRDDFDGLMRALEGWI
jgi:pimeloyl-ACP methyl ester carboxylesterase